MRRISWTFSGCSVQKLCVVFSQEIALRATEELQLTGGKLVRDVLQHKKVSPCEKVVFGENLPIDPHFFTGNRYAFAVNWTEGYMYSL